MLKYVKILVYKDEELNLYYMQLSGERDSSWHMPLRHMCLHLYKTKLFTCKCFVVAVVVVPVVVVWGRGGGSRDRISCVLNSLGSRGWFSQF